MIFCSFKINNESYTFQVESIYVGDSHCNLHFDKNYNKIELYKFSLLNKLELYKYPDDGHIGIKIPLDSIYWLKYDDEAK